MWQVRLLWALCAVAWLCAEWRLHRRPQRVPGVEYLPIERASRHLLWGGITLGLLVALGCKVSQLSPLPLDYLPRQALAALIVALGLTLRYRAVCALGGLFTTDIAIHREHRLIEHGPYRYLRHPAYSGLLLAVSGAALALGDAVGGVVWIGLTTAALLHRITLEEQTLSEVFGDAYKDYCRARWRLIPGVY